MVEETPNPNAREHWRRPAWLGYVVTAAAQTALTVALSALEPVFPLAHYPMAYIVVTMVVAYAFGEGPAILSVLLGFAAFTYLFVPPHHVIWPIASGAEGWARVTAFFLGVSIVAVAAVQVRKSQRRIQRYGDEAVELNASLTEEIEERNLAEASLRESEERFRTLFGSLPVGVVLIDPDSLGFTMFNDAALRYLGYTEQEMKKLHVPDIEVLHDEQLVRHNIRRFVRNETLEFESKHRTKTGEVRDVLVKGQGLESGGRRAALAIWVDITDRRKAEDEVRTLNAELEQRVKDRTAELEASNKELEAFSYSVSHDLRAPLRAIDGFSNAVLKNYLGSLDERGQDYLRRIRAAAQRMAQLIDDILGLSRAGRAEMHRQKVDMSAMAQDILEDLRKSHPERSAESSIEAGMIVNADSHLLRIALNNLLGNAWKFTTYKDVARIEMGSHREDTERVYYVRDNGAGFNPAYTDRLFSPFQRLHTEDEFPGTGIGLALVQRILRKHGGRIWAESAPDQGATFYFTLGGEVNE